MDNPADIVDDIAKDPAAWADTVVQQQARIDELKNELQVSRGETRFCEGAVGSHSRELADRDATIEQQAATLAVYEEALIDIREVYTGSEGIPKPETAAEAYLLRLLQQTYEIAAEALTTRNTPRVQPDNSGESQEGANGEQP